MNCFYFSKKFNYIACLLNILGSIAWIVLLLVIYVYHFHVLIGDNGSSNYSQLVTNATASASSSVAVSSVQATNDYPGAYIAIEGFAKFFNVYMWGGMTYWHLVATLFFIGSVSYVLKTILNLTALFLAYKCKSILYVHLSAVDLFCPLFGGIYGLSIANKNKKLIEPKHVFPIRWIRFKIKTYFTNFYSDRPYRP